MEKGRDIRDLKGMKVCAIGSKTAEAIGRLGIRVDMVPDEFSAEGLIDAFCALGRPGVELAGLSILLPRAERGTGRLPREGG